MEACLRCNRQSLPSMPISASWVVYSWQNIQQHICDLGGWRKHRKRNQPPKRGPVGCHPRLDDAYGQSETFYTVCLTQQSSLLWTSHARLIGLSCSAGPQPTGCALGTRFLCGPSSGHFLPARQPCAGDLDVVLVKHNVFQVRLSLYQETGVRRTVGCEKTGSCLHESTLASL